uniref:alkyl/aryl-sulfatase n=1 Tax=Ningiella ruwaisensis TaxID=2364274 RepID=UPI00109F38E3|nr:alkyl sulfatase dimerization domain-containing protein [Ningiella ruwaisensis]
MSYRILGIFSLTVLFTAHFSSLADTTSKDASASTKAFQQSILEALPFEDRRDFELAEKGLIKRPDEVTIKDENGKVVWELGNYNFLMTDEPIDTIHPSLLRQAKLNMHYGLYRVTENIYQVRGYDLANMTFVKGDSGWIVFDTMLTPATAKAAFALVTEELGEFPIKAVIYSHAHADHFGGIKGIVSQAQVDNGEVQIIAPRDFMDHAIKENVLAGNAMTRRATYQYGNALPKGPKGQVDAAIGKGISNGFIGLIAPSKVIEEDEETLIIDGVKMVFQNTPNTESPSEMNTYLPQYKAFWAAENVIGALHNVYTLRGAQVRDALGWSKYINEVIHKYAKDAQLLFASHSWPRWGNEYLLEVLKKQRDLYGYLHDQTLHLANQGVTINEIHNELEVPDVLSHEWYNRGYHGSYSHNVRGIINKYLGFFDMNPANLNKLSPADSAPRYVKAMGGSEALLKLAREAYNAGDYRWGAELLNHLVFAEPDNQSARLLQADMFEQMGYQSESAGWRNTYLAGAYELRFGKPEQVDAVQAGPDMIRAMDSGLIFDFLGVRLNAQKALGKSLKINIVFPDENTRYLLELENAHLNNIKGIQAKDADVTVTMNRRDLDLMLMKAKSLGDLISEGKVTFDGEQGAFTSLLQLTEEFPFWFDIVTP